MNKLNNEILSAKVGAALIARGLEIEASESFLTLAAVMTDVQHLLKDENESAEDYHAGREELYQLFSLVWDEANKMHEEGLSFPERHEKIGLGVLPSIAIQAMEDDLVFAPEALADFAKWAIGVHAAMVGDFKLEGNKAAESQVTVGRGI